MRLDAFRASALAICLLAGVAAACSTAAQSLSLQANDGATTTPIKHVIVIIGENRSFDHIFGAYQPRPGQAVFNLLSEGIIGADGLPGPNFGKAAQYRALVEGKFESAPAHKQPYDMLPPAMTGSAPPDASDGADAPFLSMAHAAAMDPGIPGTD